MNISPLLAIIFNYQIFYLQIAEVKQSKQEIEIFKKIMQDG